jgi:hypothetical protein
MRKQKTANKRDYSLLLSTMVFMLGGPSIASKQDANTTDSNTVIDVVSRNLLQVKATEDKRLSLKKSSFSWSDR